MNRVLVCPLDWGLGHASRDVEIISNYIKQGYEVIIAADKAPMLFLKQHFPNLKYVVMQGVSITYSKQLPFKLKMLLSLPKILYGIAKEHWELKKIIEKYKIDIVISDNRYGLWNKNVHSIFITHQIWIKVSKIKIIEQLANYINHFFIKKFNECWIPDYKGSRSVAGELSNTKKIPENVKYIGILSRFKDNVKYYKQELDKSLQAQNFDILAIISGPEPQRSVFENIIIKQVKTTGYKALILQGNPSRNQKHTNDNITLVNHIDSYNLRELINKTPIIICRSGYSSIMDLLVLKKKAIIIPTIGQTEQEYLAEYLSNKNLFYIYKQNNFKLPLL